MRYRGSYFSYVLALFSYYFSFAIFSSILSVYLHAINKSSLEISFIISGSYLFSLIMIPVVSYLYDHASKPQRVTGTVLLLAGLTGLGFAFIGTTWLLFILNGLSMSLLQCVTPICEQLCSGGQYRYGAVRVWGSIGFAIAAQVAGVVYQYIAPRVLFIIYAVFTGIAYIGFAGASETSLVKPKPSKEPVGKQGLFWMNKQFLLFLAATFVFYGITSLGTTYLPILLVERGQTVAQADTVLFLGTLMEIPLTLLSARFMDRYSSKTLLVTAFFILIIQFSMNGLSRTAWPVVISSVLLKCVATMLFIMITIKFVANAVDERFDVSALGIAATVKALGSAAFQNVGGWYIALASLNAMYLLLVAFSLLGGLLSLAIQPAKTGTVFQ